MFDKSLDTCTTLRPLRFAVLAVSFVFPTSSSLLAQSTPGLTVQANQSPEAQIKFLTDRVAKLEQKLAKLDARVTSDENSQSNQDTPDEKTPTSVGGLSKSDESRIASLEKQVNKIEAEQKDQNQGESHQIQNRVTAPFQVLDANGAVIMDVEAGSGRSGNLGGVKVAAPNGSFVNIGAGATGFAGVRVYDTQAAKNPRVFMGMQAGTIATVLIGGKNGMALGQLADHDGNGELDLMNTSGTTVALIGSNPTNSEGHADFTDSGGTPLAKIGAAGPHGDVLLGGEGKGIAVWEEALTGFLR